MEGQLLKARICSTRSKFFPLGENPILEGLCPPDSKHKSLKLFPFEKIVIQHGGVPEHLNDKMQYFILRMPVGKYCQMFQ